MAQAISSTLLLACSLTLGPLISTSHHVTTKTYDDVRATLHWTAELRWQHPDETGQRYKATALGPAYVRVSAPGMTPQVLSLTPFLAAGHAYAPVDGPGDGCGAATNLTIVPKAGSRLPYVVAFVVLAEKGCMAVPIVFVPVRTGGRYAYLGARYYALWSSVPHPTSEVRAASIDRISVPAGEGGSDAASWILDVVTNALPTGPRIVTFAPPNKPKQIRPSSAILLGDPYFAWFAH